MKKIIDDQLMRRLLMISIVLCVTLMAAAQETFCIAKDGKSQ